MQGPKADPGATAATGTVPGARTRIQRPGGPVPPRTPAEPSPTTTPPTATPPAGPADFPVALTDRYHPVGRVGSGSEGTVWHARRVDALRADGRGADGGRGSGGSRKSRGSGAGSGTSDGDAAVKVGYPGVRAETELLAHLASDPLFRRHVPEILGHGRVEHAGALCDWLAMEYLPLTLADHVAALRGQGRLGRRGETERIVRELVDLLEFWQVRIKRNPVDFKPANILVRQGGRNGGSAAEFVVADFGGVAKLTASRRFATDMQVTVAYMAPEQLAGSNDPAGPWWALGTILYEVFTGASRYRRADGGLVSDEALQFRLVMDDEVDLAAVPDERHRLLLQGLFTKDPADRWTAPQVRAWLNGESPEVVRSRVAPPPPAPTPPPGPGHRPIAFREEDFHEPAALAEALLKRSADAAAWLVSGGARRLRDWLRDEVKDTVLDLHYLKDVERGTSAEKSAAASRAVLALGAAFTPGAVPYVRDRRVDAAGLVELAEQPDASTVVDELVAAGLLGLAARFHCGHPACPERACARLLGLTELAAVLNRVEREARTLGGRNGNNANANNGRNGNNANANNGRNGNNANANGTTADGRLTAAERKAARRWILLLTLQPDGQRRALVRRLSALPGPLGALPAPVHSTVTAVTDGAGAVAARVRGGGRERFRRDWSDLRRRALTADPATADGRGVLAAAAVLQVRSVRSGGAQRGRNRGAWKADLRAWRSGAQSALPRRAVAGVLLFLCLAATLWAGTVLRISFDAGVGGAVSPDGAFGGPLRTAGEAAARATAGQLGAALVAALAVAAFPARIGRRILFLAAAASFAIGYLHLGPPMTVLRPPQAVIDRVVVFEGGTASWAGAAAMATPALVLFVNGRSVRWLLTPAHEAAQRAAGDRRNLATRRRARGNGTGAARRWRPGRDGYRDRLLFWLGGTLVLTLVLWAAVEVRLAVVHRDDHPTPASWGTGQVGAAYQADYLLLLAFLTLVAAATVPRAARRLLAAAAVGTAVLGAWPPPLGPLEALRIPVLGPWFRALAELWGHAAFWAAVLVVLPLACYLAVWTSRRIGE
ncbi:protein kinase domain-containing protein [Kitasatospora purpeofusca]|uniref:protein kinase domain-containing protein n=1 Tax=Kitasatospora purpeofusca TaxID=67352 RepID=UPI0036C0DB4B